MKNQNIFFQQAFIVLFLLVSGQNLGQSSGMEIDSVKSFPGDGLRVTYAIDDGIEVTSAGRKGVFVQNAGLDGVFVQNAEFDGLVVGNAGREGVFVQNAGLDGVFVQNAGRAGVFILSAVDDGVFVQNAGGYSMNIQGLKSADADPENHIAQIFNRSTSTSPDVLALKVGTTSNPDFRSNFITFFNGQDSALGRIEGNGSGGVMYGTSGADFAEVLPRSEAAGSIHAGDIVGVSNGTISHKTFDADQLMIITDRPAVLGNQRSEDDPLSENVSFIGQVPVRVVGSVQSGDWIIPSGQNDGIGRAVTSEALTLDHRIVCRAWETNSAPELKKVNCAVGLDQSEAKDVILKNMQMEYSRKFENQEKRIQQLESLLTEIMKK